MLLVALAGTGGLLGLAAWLGVRVAREADGLAASGRRLAHLQSGLVRTARATERLRRRQGADQGGEPGHR